MIVGLFWNRGERRLRAALRVVLFIALTILVDVLIGGLYDRVGLDVDFRTDAPLWVFLLIGVQTLGAGLGCTWLLVRFVDRRRFRDLGLVVSRDWWLDLAFGLVLGLALPSLVFVLGWSAGWVEVEALWFTSRPHTGALLPILTFLVVTVFFGIAEEVISRGYLLTNLAEGLNLRGFDPRWAVAGGWVLSSALFGAFHLDNDHATVLSTSNIMLGGMFLGLAYVLTGRLAVPIGIHTTWNFALACVYAFPVSGIDVPGEVAAVVKTRTTGPDLWVGGEFGPEGGLVVTLALVLGSLAVLGWYRLRSKEISLYPEIARPPRRTDRPGR